MNLCYREECYSDMCCTSVIGISKYVGFSCPGKFVKNERIVKHYRMLGSRKLEKCFTVEECWLKKQYITFSLLQSNFFPQLYAFSLPKNTGKLIL